MFIEERWLPCNVLQNSSKCLWTYQLIRTANNTCFFFKWVAFNVCGWPWLTALNAPNPIKYFGTIIHCSLTTNITGHYQLNCHLLIGSDLVIAPYHMISPSNHLNWVEVTRLEILLWNFKEFCPWKFFFFIYSYFSIFPIIRAVVLLFYW